MFGCATPLLKPDELVPEVQGPSVIQPGAEAIRFAVYGDNRLARGRVDRDSLSSRRRRRRRVTGAIAAGQPDFVLHTGDLVERGDDRELWQAFLSDSRPLLRPRYFYPAVGNHEYKGDFLEAFHEIAPNGAKNVKGYAFRAGSSYVIVFDFSAEPHPTVADGFHSAWLKERLLVAQSARFLFVVSHHPLYSSGRGPVGRFLISRGEGGHAPRKKDIALRSILRQNLQQRKRRDPSARTVVLTGHSHFYERYVADGIDYVVTGGGGAPSHTPTRTAPHRKEAYEGDHFVEISCADDTLKIDMIPVGTGDWIQRAR